MCVPLKRSRCLHGKTANVVSDRSEDCLRICGIKISPILNSGVSVPINGGDVDCSCDVFLVCGVAQVLVADSDDEVVDHASLLNSFGNDNTNIITPVPRMHSIKPEWDEDVSSLVIN